MYTYIYICTHTPYKPLAVLHVPSRRAPYSTGLQPAALKALGFRAPVT